MPVSDGTAFAARARITRSLLFWYRRTRRDLPWRRTRDPYRIWVSEVMLQQTRVSVVAPYYERFLAAFPTPDALASASEEEVLRLWQGLGYYARARNLQRGARWVVERHGGLFPRDPDAARRVPGVGAYTMGAVLSIAYGVRLPAIDANAERVLARLAAITGNLRSTRTKRRLVALATDLLPRRDPGELNQALMELGALVCTPGAPRCEVCPVSGACLAFAEGTAAAIPPRRARVARAVQSTVAAVCRRRGRYLVGCRAEGGLWTGMWEFPWAGTEDPSDSHALARLLEEQCGLQLQGATEADAIRHGLMERTVELRPWRCTVRGRARPRFHRELRWATPEELLALPMPRPHRRIAERVGAGEPHS